MKKGYVQVYTGDGKGKTTAALGLGVRAVGRGLKVIMIQFLKGTFTGELEGVKKLSPQFHIIRFAETEKFFWNLTEDEKHKLREKTQMELKKLDEYMKDDACDVLILDEIMAAIHGGLVSVEQVCNIIDNKPEGMEIILTGRNVPEQIAERADLITEMKAIKHYFRSGVPSREGIEL
jgi:cob(I)alamin adenosyltransferase